MFRDAQAETPLPPCCACDEPAPHSFWGSQLCDACHVAWVREAPPLEQLEVAHANAHPDDIEHRGVHQWVDNRPWVILKPGVTERVAKEAARAWVLARRAALKAAA